jgi:hypothetical protein
MKIDSIPYLLQLGILKWNTRLLTGSGKTVINNIVDARVGSTLKLAYF